MALIAAAPKATFYPSSPSLYRIRRARPSSNSTLVRAISSVSLTGKVNSNAQFVSNLFINWRNKNKRCSASISCSGAAFEENYGKILLSDVTVTRRPKVYLGRKWTSVDIATGTVVLSMHVLCLFAPFTFNWPAFCVALLLYVVTGLFGITLSFHRNLAHRSFKLPKWLEYFFAYCGAQAMQGHPIDWVSTHRYHHQFCDSERDPHSPLEGFWFSHMSWFFDTKSLTEKCGTPNNVSDLEKQPFYKFIEKTYAAHPVALAGLLYALGGFPFLVWGMGVRIVWVYHITWLVNSACHVWGSQSWNTGDLSRNNWWVALLAFGEGWHNNHHAFEFSARHGLEWWQLDVTWYTIKFLQAVGLATDVKVPSESQKQRMCFIE
ncbi:Palmitoyl-monogalactosyldiacylglycerol delta-7 desaturase protein [Thalictrum thalictroides]|uniref:Palmitoyl-monogalactosyldiacylglycerol delta-7 desaturase protein n=1 Tax=Thalictrum thalictroides TaxID=46969 RepID=A0A7J6VED5_THATH|nr:Palmitoyl-monogalactosyldiacylglycerol delta-7 desaturase protein [Thalictrum thalictroides]